MRRTVNDIEAFCTYEAHRAIESNDLDAADYEWEAGQLIKCDVGGDPHRLNRLACHGWADWVNYDERYEEAPKANATLTQLGAKMLTYYTRALADVGGSDERVLEDGVNPFFDRTEMVWEEVLA